MRNDPESLERDNDAAIGHMSDRVAMLRSITDNIHNEAESHKKLLDGKFLFIFAWAIGVTSCFVHRDGRLHGGRRGDFRGDGEALQRGVREQQERTAVLLRGVGDGGCHLVPPLPQLGIDEDETRQFDLNSKMEEEEWRGGPWKRETPGVC